MKDILIVAHFSILEGEGGNGRFSYLAEKLVDRDEVKVELVTSTFSHNEKKQRKVLKPSQETYKTTLLYEPGYQKNISVERILSHKKMAESLKKYLERRRDEPDIVYCSVPSLDVAQVAGSYARARGIRFIIDVQDLWPEAFQMAFYIPFMSRILFYPIKRHADKVYQMADEIVAVSDTYGKRAFQVNKKCGGWTSCFLGADLAYFDSCRREENKKRAPFQIAYVGSLGHSYDIECVIKALWLLKRKGIHIIQFLVMGEGALRKRFEDFSKELGVDSIFTGRLEYSEMVARLCQCDVAVNPIRHRAAQSIINKVGDYAAAGLPVINTQECMEYRKLIEKYECGLNCRNGNSRDVARAIYLLYRDKGLRMKQGKNSRKMAEQLFDRKKSYEKVLDIILRQK